MRNNWSALKRGETAQERRRVLEHAHEHVLGESVLATPDAERDRLAAGAGVRPIVFDSWVRSLSHDLDPTADHPGTPLNADALAQLQEEHPLNHLLPVIHRLLLPDSRDSGIIVAVGDAGGRLLWVDGDRGLRSRAEDMGFLPGMDWSEQAVGTSAPGSALALGHSFQVFGAEHFQRQVHQWSCAAAPVRDPATGAIIGVIDITGGDDIAEPHVMPLVEATLAAVHAELKLEHLRNTYEQAAPKRTIQAPHLRILGRDRGLFEHGNTRFELNPRHTEILTALARAHPTGLSAGALAEVVYGDASSANTVRPEIVRLRKVLGPHLEIASQPYRLTTPLRIDAAHLREAIARGAHRLALATYEGPPLPHSEAPAVRELADSLAHTLREAMLQQAAPDVLYDYAERWGSDDEAVWQTLLTVLPPLSPKRARVVAHLELLQR